MGYFYAYVLVLLKLINIIKGEFYIEIYRNVNGAEIPVFESISQYAGTNLTLICQLVNSDINASHFDGELSWGRKLQEFNNATDTKYQFITKNNTNRAIKSFHPLLTYDSGAHFCISAKYQLFKLIKLHVSSLSSQLHRTKDIRYSQSAFNFNSKTRRSLRNNCTNDEFSCETGGTCVEYKYVCDNVKDCKDGSDETFNLCGYKPCSGKRQCSNGRCISESFCCDKSQKPNCRVEVRPACCFEQNGNGTGINMAEVKDGVEANKGKVSNFQIMWIVVICAITLVFATMCLVLIHSRAKETRNLPTKNAAKARKHSQKHGQPETDAVKTTSFTSTDAIQNVTENC